MSDLRIASRFSDENRGERCPRCLMLNRNFLELSDVMLGCLDCGSVFIRKSFRVALDVRGMLESQMLECGKVVGEAKPAGHVCCDCGLECKSAAGLAAHRRVNH